MDAPLRLNLGCGDDIMSGWINVDAHNNKANVKANINKLPYSDDTVDVILASHVIEHFNFREAFDALLEWHRVLKPGGKLVIETPDMMGSCKAFVETDETGRIALYGQFFAQSWIPGQVHYFLYTEIQLYGTLNTCGFKNIVRVPPDSTYSRLAHWDQIFLRMECIK